MITTTQITDTEILAFIAFSKCMTVPLIVPCFASNLRNIS